MNIIRLDIKKILLYIYTFLFYASVFRVSADELPRFAQFDIILTIIRYSMLFYCLFRLRVIEAKTTLIDLICVACFVSMCMTAVLNSSVFIATLKAAARIITFWFVSKVTMVDERKYSFSMIKAASDYLLVICIINTIYAIMVGGKEHGVRFLLGSDNGSANIYFLMIMFCFIKYEISGFRKRYLIDAILGLITTSVFGSYLQIGSMVLWLVVGLIFILYYGKNLQKRRVSVSIFMTTYCVLFLAFSSLISNQRIKQLVDYYLWGKSKSLMARVLLWDYFISKIKSNVLFGIGEATGEYSYMRGTNMKFMLEGNTHNLLLEIIYRYGWVMMILFLIFIIMVEFRIKDSNNTITNTVLVCFMLFMMHSIIEVGVRYVFIYIPFAYYSRNLVENFEGYVAQWQRRQVRMF